MLVGWVVGGSGKEYLFVSNVDNLGALVDLSVLYHLIDNEIDMAICAVECTRADTEGGLLVAYKGE